MAGIGSERDPQAVTFIWPDVPEGALPDDEAIGVMFEFVTSDGPAGWDCERITIKPLDARGGPLAERFVRTLPPLARLLRRGRAGIWGLRIVEGRVEAEAAMMQGVAVEEIEWPPRIDKRGRRAVGQDGVRPPSRKRMEHLREVADVFRAEEARETSGRRRPVQVVAETFGLSPNTAAKQIKRCRGLGLIGPPANLGNRDPRPKKYPPEFLREVARVYNGATGDPVGAVVEILETGQRPEAEELVGAARSEGLIDANAGEVDI